SICRAVRMRANFGFQGSRQARSTAFNAKLSEYHAAVGHAALDEWEQARAEWNCAAAAYRHALGNSNQVSLQPGFGDAWVGSTCLLSFIQPVADRVEASLADRHIDTRRWWGQRCARAPGDRVVPAYPGARDRRARSLHVGGAVLSQYRLGR